MSRGYKLFLLVLVFILYPAAEWIAYWLKYAQYVSH